MFKEQKCSETMLDTIGCQGHKWADFSCNSWPVNYYKCLTPWAWCRLGFNDRKWDSWEILARSFPQFPGNVKTEKKLTWVLFIKKCSLLMNTKHLGSIAHVPTSELTLWDWISTVTHFVWCGFVYAHIQKKKKVSAKWKNVTKRNDACCCKFIFALIGETQNIF